PVAAALTVTHSLVPPHPAPSAAAQLLGADLGRTILYGALTSIPMVLVGGMLYGRWISKRMFVPVPAIATREAESQKGPAPPPVPVVILLLILPVMCIFAATISNMTNSPSKVVLGFIGHPFVSLLIT